MNDDDVIPSVFRIQYGGAILQQQVYSSASFTNEQRQEIDQTK